MANCEHEAQYEYDAEQDCVKSYCKRCGVALGGTLGKSFTFQGSIVTSDPEDFMNNLRGRGGAGVPVR